MNTTLDVRGLSKRYSRRRVVEDLHLQASSGQVLGLVGANGSGKSTVIKMIAGLVRPDAGSVHLRLDDADIDQSKVHEHCALVAPYLELYDEFSPLELLHLHAELHGRSTDNDRSAHLLEVLGLTSVSSRTVRSFSSGMRQRVAIAIALSLRPPLLLLDEPGVTLDEAGRSALAACITNARQDGSVIILATNDDRERSLCDRMVRMTSDEVTK